MGSERARSEGVGSSAEHPKSAGGEAGDAHHTDKSPRRNPLRDWSDDDEETLTHVGGEATPRGGDGIIDPPKAADAGSSHASAATSRPHGKADVAPRKPTAKRTADPAAAGRPPVKKRRRAVPVALMRPSVSMVVGVLYEMEAASWAWARAAEAREWAVEESAWPEMPAGMFFVPLMEE
ncbi:hypothetical protein TRIUR3_29739 [Triticum urartu]|uniref:Uncharacterized protein n=1 Tax=Triticum urartu TaxID=4572 RepID=M8A7J4_TRIUA|nr:hypothetical protein TRIUR3_29739 [Triticum urartu]